MLHCQTSRWATLSLALSVSRLYDAPKLIFCWKGYWNPPEVMQPETWGCSSLTHVIGQDTNIFPFVRACSPSYNSTKITVIELNKFYITSIYTVRNEVYLRYTDWMRLLIEAFWNVVRFHHKSCADFTDSPRNTLIYPMVKNISLMLHSGPVWWLGEALENR